MIKCAEEGSNYTRALHAYRNTPRSDGFSPFQLMFGRIGKTLLPALNSAFSSAVNMLDGAAARQAARDSWEAAGALRGRKTVFHQGDLVNVQDATSARRRGSIGHISSATPSGGSYVVTFEDGSEKMRNE